MRGIRRSWHRKCGRDFHHGVDLGAVVGGHPKLDGRTGVLCGEYSPRFGFLGNPVDVIDRDHLGIRGKLMLESAYQHDRRIAPGDGRCITRTGFSLKST